jgi:DNA helicase-2/ATP-dependent DNA helicase PcrA
MCARMLRMGGDQIGLDPRFVIYDSDDATRLVKEVLRDLDIDSERYPAARILGRISDAKNNMRGPEQVSDLAASPADRVIARLYAAYQQRLGAARALDFDDLLLYGVKLMQEAPAGDTFAERFEHVLIDEFQDANLAQFTWAREIARVHRNIAVVGDDDQCLPPGTCVAMPKSSKPIESVQVGETVLCGAGRASIAPGIVEKAIERPYAGPLVHIETKGGRRLKLTPNHICFARLGVRPDVHYVYLMYRHDKGFRIGITVGARSDGRRSELQNGLRVRVNQEKADKVWILRVCSSRAEAAFYENLYAFRYGIPTTIFYVAGRGPLNLTQEAIDELFESIDTRHRAAQLMDELNLDAAHPHYRPGGLGSEEKPHRLTVHFTAFGGNGPSIESPWYRHRVWLNTSNRLLETQVIHGGIATRPGKAGTWRVERIYKEMQRTAAYAEQVAQAAGGADIARWAAFSSGDKFAFQPAMHLRPTMIVPVLEGTQIGEDEIISVDTSYYEGPVYDLNVSHLHNFVAEGIVVHNSIYAWRGADVRLILDFEKHYPDAEVIRLEQNYRSTQKILDAAHGVISQNIGRAPKRLWTDEGGGAQLTLHGLANAQEEAFWVARKIQDLQRENHAKLSDFAILCRVNAQSRPFEEAFLRLRIPLRLVGTQRFYERREIKDLLGYLRVLFNPNDGFALLRIINTPPRGIGATTIQKLQMLAYEQGRPLYEIINDEEALKTLGRAPALKLGSVRDLLNQLQDDLKNATSMADLISHVLLRTGFEDYLRREKSRDSVDRVANVEELLSAAAAFDERMKTDESQSDEEFVHESSPYLGLFLETTALDSQVNTAQDEGEAVTLMTLHSAKGLEFPTVFLVGAEQGLLPHSRALWGASPDELEEERRLCYVGLTRARERVFLTYAAQRTLHGRTETTQPSQFIEEIPGHLLERGGFAATRSFTPARAATFWQAPARSETSSAPVEPPKFTIGDRVEHPSFGEGLVVDASPPGEKNEWVHVAFLKTDVGKKRLVVAYAPLEKIA